MPKIDDHLRRNADHENHPYIVLQKLNIDRGKRRPNQNRADTDGKNLVPIGTRHPENHKAGNRDRPNKGLPIVRAAYDVGRDENDGREKPYDRNGKRAHGNGNLRFVSLFRLELKFFRIVALADKIVQGNAVKFAEIAKHVHIGKRIPVRSNKARR